MKRSIAIVAALTGLLVLVPSALADSSMSTSSTTTSDVPSTTSTEVPETTSTTPSTTATTTTTTTTATPTTTGTTTDVPETTDVGTTVPDVDADDCVADCIPTDVAGTCATCISGAGGVPTGVAGSGALPFTGIEDMIAPILLALTVVLGGVVAWRWAQLRESVARDASQARPQQAKEAARTGYATALRHQVIEQRARRVFTPRVA